MVNHVLFAIVFAAGMEFKPGFIRHEAFKQFGVGHIVEIGWAYFIFCHCKQKANLSYNIS